MRLIYFAFYLITVIVATIFFKKTNKSLALKNISKILILYYYFMIFHIIGAGLIILGIKSKNIYYSSISLSENEIVKIALFISLTFMIISILLFLIDKKYKIKINREKILFSNKNKSLELGLIIFLILVLAGLIITGIENVGFPIFEVIKGSGSLRIGIARSQFHTTIPYIKNLVVIVGSPILASISYVLFKCYKKSIISIFLLVISWLVFFFSSIMTTAKMPIIKFFLFYIILNYYIGNKFNVRKLFIYGILVLSILLLFNATVEQNIDNIMVNFISLFERIFLAQNNGLFLMYDYFKNNEFLGIGGVSNIIAKIFGTEFIEPHELLMRTYSPGAIMRGTAGEMSTLFIGEAFAVGGWYMVFLSIILFSLIIYFVHLFFEKIAPKNAFFIALHAYFTLYWVKPSSGFFTNFILNWSYIFIVFIFILGFIPYLAVKRNSLVKT